jgi:hypothetical protein
VLPSCRVRLARPLWPTPRTAAPRKPTARRLHRSRALLLGGYAPVGSVVGGAVAVDESEQWRRPLIRRSTGASARVACRLLLSCDSQASGMLALALRVSLRRSRLKLESDEPLVADHPHDVAGLNDVRLAAITAAQLGLRSRRSRSPGRASQAVALPWYRSGGGPFVSARAIRAAPSREHSRCTGCVRDQT